MISRTMFNIHCLWFSVKAGVELSSLEKGSWKNNLKVSVSHKLSGDQHVMWLMKRDDVIWGDKNKSRMSELGETFVLLIWAVQTTSEAGAHFWTILQESEHCPCGQDGEGRAGKKVLGGRPIQKSCDQGSTSPKGFPGQRHRCGLPGLYHLT